ncbi:hypothetical protein RirG_135170 [Rhizophagus irregularis DAOM 197198w]|uniref:Uncharacterized protein n=1 Tax=Rhizophagus irregularis (strain DAOM 197198w) TaxID=1432141 RepID=A0A015J6S9_RHIIW|nr:hypothetical protein RirG_135170 [Rhizophagus irregularis DAOM 197198w]
MEKIVNKSKPSEEKIVELVEVPCGRTSTISTPAQVSQNKDQGPFFLDLSQLTNEPPP